jgi:hypothetical protein
MKVPTLPSHDADERKEGSSEADGNDGDPHDLEVRLTNSTPFLLYISSSYCRNGGRRQEQGKGSARIERAIYMAATKGTNRTHADSALTPAPHGLRKRAGTPRMRRDAIKMRNPGRPTAPMICAQSASRTSWPQNTHAITRQVNTDKPRPRLGRPESPRAHVQGHQSWRRLNVVLRKPTLGPALRRARGHKGIGAGRRWASAALIDGAEPHDHLSLCLSHPLRSLLG